MRSSDMSVLTVGAFVFSSDPRISIVSPGAHGQTFGTWSLQISPTSVQDSGEYQCQVNSEPKEALDFTLLIKGIKFLLVTTVLLSPSLQRKNMMTLLIKAEKKKSSLFSTILTFQNQTPPCQ